MGFIPSRWKPFRGLSLLSQAEGVQSASCRPKGNASSLWLVTSKAAPIRWSSTVSPILTTWGQLVALPATHCCLCTWGKPSHPSTSGAGKLSSSLCPLLLIKLKPLSWSQINSEILSRASSSLTCSVSPHCVAAASTTPPRASFTRPLGVQAASCSAAMPLLTLCLLPGAPACSRPLPQPLKSCLAQVPISVWTNLSTPSSRWDLSLPEPPGHFRCPVFLPSVYVALQSSRPLLCPSPGGQLVSTGVMLELQHLPQCLACNRHSFQ